MDLNQEAPLVDLIGATKAQAQWQRVGIRQHHGICIPLFSLHSDKSAGIGEFPDLLPLISWLHKVGFDTLQLLPLNDTGPNTSPYSAISAFALNPLHLGIASLPYIEEDSKFTALLKELQLLNKTERVNYAKVQPLRDFFLKKYFDDFSSNFLDTPEYQRFVEENPWLPGYALFKSIKSHCLWHSWTSWPEEIKNCTPESYEKLQKKFETDIAYHSFIQYLCFQQMSQVREHAEAEGVFLKGDLPILLDLESADIWLNRNLFNLELTAGAPPDAYSALGQSWGFPMYNWEDMEKKNFAWWRQRLAVASNFYHIFRIDHIVGFFRIWAIPAEHSALEGHFIPNDPQIAIEQGSKLMKMMLSASPMLPIGEDLGTVPTEVRKVLTDLGICGTRVMRWERKWEIDQSFIHPKDYAALSITTVSTHDSSPLKLWWTENSDESRAYCLSQGWEYKTPLSSEFQFAMLYASHHTSSLFHINLLNEYLALIPGFVSPNPVDERINLPGIVSDDNWSYRFRPSVETLVADPNLSRLMRDLIAE
jgi:4-alpha-glucanotransferase